MKYSIYYLVLTTGIYMLFGCASTNTAPGESIASERDGYQLSARQDGSMYRINTKSGKVWRIEGNILEAIDEPKPLQLKIGSKYYIENNQSIEYLGNGAFTKPIKDFSYLWK